MAERNNRVTSLHRVMYVVLVFRKSHHHWTNISAVFRSSFEKSNDWRHNQAPESTAPTFSTPTLQQHTTYTIPTR